MTIVRRVIGIAFVVALAACSSGNGGFAPAAGGGPPAPAFEAARASAQSGSTVRDFSYHIMPLRTQRKSVADAGGLQYPDDLTNYGGRVMTSEITHNIYVNCPAKSQSCWGAPEGFQTALAGSSFAGLLQQYTGTGPGSFTFGDSTAVTFPLNPGTALYENDLFQILHQVVSATKKVGFGHLYHIFLPKGTDTCFDFSAQCYSPDYARTMAFCAYHGAVRFSDVGTVIYSIEPYQDIPGCKTAKSSGASELTNSTISTLAHETFESITDPGFKLAWYNFQGGEIGDECEFFVSRVKVGGKVYNSQPMYSNAYHACATKP